MAAALGNHGIDFVDQGIQVKRLGDVVVRTGLEQAHGGINVSMAGNKDERWQAQVFTPQLLIQGIAGDVGQADVTDDQCVTLGAQGSASSAAVTVPVKVETLQGEAIGK